MICRFIPCTSAATGVHELTGGQAWWDEILRRIRDCEVFVFALSPKALESPACDREWRYASALGKGVLPVLIEGEISVALLPPQLAAIQYIDYREQSKQAALRLTRAVDQAVVAGPLPEPLPPAPEVPLSYLGGLRETIHSPNNLTFPEQSALVIKLRHALREEHDRAGIESLIRQLLDRDDVLARVAEELRQLLAEATAAPAVPAPAAPAPAEAVHAAPPTPTRKPGRTIVLAGGAMLLLLMFIGWCSEPAPTVPVVDSPAPTAAPPAEPSAADKAPPAPAPDLPAAQKKQITQDIDQLLKAPK